MKNSIADRDSNFELLRIVSMFMIIIHHFFCYGFYSFSLPYKIDDFILIIFQSGGKIGAALFIMITGYYMVYVEKIKIKKLIELECKALYYSIGIFLALLLFFNRNFSLDEIIKTFFPNLSGVYWFFSGYFFIYVLSPYINKFIFSIDKKELRNFLVICFVFLMLIPSVFIFNSVINEFVYYSVTCCFQHLLPIRAG